MANPFKKGNFIYWQGSARTPVPFFENPNNRQRRIREYLPTGSNLLGRRKGEGLACGGKGRSAHPTRESDSLWEGKKHRRKQRNEPRERPSSSLLQPHSASASRASIYQSHQTKAAIPANKKGNRYLGTVNYCRHQKKRKLNDIDITGTL